MACPSNQSSTIHSIIFDAQTWRLIDDDDEIDF
jgi:hypothetical protein